MTWGPTRNIQRRPDSRYCEPRAGDADGDPNLVERRTRCRNRGWRWTRSDGRNLDDDGAPRFWRGLRAVPLAPLRSPSQRRARRRALARLNTVPLAAPRNPPADRIARMAPTITNHPPQPPPSGIPDRASSADNSIRTRQPFKPDSKTTQCHKRGKVLGHYCVPLTKGEVAY